MRAEIAVEPSSKASLLKELKIKTKYFGWGGGRGRITPASHFANKSIFFL